MGIVMTPRRQRPRRGRSGGTAFIVLLAIALGAAIAFGIYVLIVKDMPNRNHVKPDFGGMDKPIFYQGNQLEKPALKNKGVLEVPLPVLQKAVDPSILYEASSKSVILATSNRVLRMKTDQLTALMNEKPYTLHVPVEERDGTIYVPADVVADLYPVVWSEASGTGAVFLRKSGEVVAWGRTPVDSKHPDRTIPMRTGPSIHEPIVSDVPQGSQAMLLGEKDGWYHVQLPDGYVGYIAADKLAYDHADTVKAAEKSEPFVPWKPIGGKVFLTWEQIIAKNPDTASIGDMQGVNVVCPTWFSLARNKNGDLYVSNHADLSYTAWAHQRNYQVWAVFSNGFDPDITHEALSTYDQRMRWTHQLLAFAKLYHLQGINLDFENVNLADKNLLTQFVRELTPLLHEQGLVVSIDVTVRGGSANWSLFYDREALGRIVDYMAVMTYDEHWATSPVAGSVSSLGWTEKGVTDIMKEDHVPAAKLLLGIPYYTRIWSETTKGGKTSVESHTATMDYVQKLIKQKKLTPSFDKTTGQHYLEYTEKGVTYKVWIEDATSLKARAELVKKYDLGGVAAWRRGFESEDTWSTISNTLAERP